MVYVWETSNLPMLRLPHPAGLNTHTRAPGARTHTHLKGTFAVVPLHLQSGRWAIGYLLQSRSPGEMNPFMSLFYRMEVPFLRSILTLMGPL